MHLAAIALAFVLLAAPLAAVAQQGGKVPRIGFLGSRSTPASPLLAEAFRQGLREHGWVDGQSIAIEWRNAEGHAERLPTLAAELVRIKVDVLVTSAGEPGIRAMKQASSTIPIVMAVSADPVGTGLVSSLARTGGNVTGLSIMAPDTGGKRLALLLEALPKVSGVAVLWNAADPAKVVEFAETQRAARARTIALQSVEVRSARDFDAAFAAIVKAKPDALVVMAEPLTVTHQKRIVDFATQHRLPLISELKEFASTGGLMTYGASLPALFRRSAYYVDRILKGAKPSDLPVEQPTTFELVINLKTAKALGLTIPPSLLLRADQIIE